MTQGMFFYLGQADWSLESQSLRLCCVFTQLDFQNVSYSSGYFILSTQGLAVIKSRRKIPQKSEECWSQEGAIHLLQRRITVLQGRNSFSQEHLAARAVLGSASHVNVWNYLVGTTQHVSVGSHVISRVPAMCWEAGWLGTTCGPAAVAECLKTPVGTVHSDLRKWEGVIHSLCPESRDQ